MLFAVPYTRCIILQLIQVYSYIDLLQYSLADPDLTGLDPVWTSESPD